MDRIEIRLKITQVALQDAAHLALDEDDLAALGAALVRDPTKGRKDANGHHLLNWRDVTVKYMVTVAANDDIVVHLMRLTPRRRPRNLKEAEGVVRDIALGVIKRRIADLLDDGG